MPLIARQRRMSTIPDEPNALSELVKHCPITGAAEMIRIGNAQQQAAGIDYLINLSGDAGVKEGHVDKLVDIAYKDVCHSCNVRDVSRADFEMLFKTMI